jgi:NAD(P)-dependent dehydrogenase (short-subunit alcohol dehydrogenase family)
VRDLRGKVAVVTGGASGIGRALADRFGAEGMRVAVADVEEETLRAAEHELAGAGVEVLAVATDVSLAESVDELARRTLERFGAVHVVCNNAGVSASGPSWEMPLASWEWVLGVNLWGVIHGLRAFVPIMVEQGEGHVVNTASVAGLRAAPSTAAYSASKHAVVAISESLHHELAMAGSAVRVSALCPDWVATRILDADRNWLPRLGAPPERAVDPAREVVREWARQQVASGAAPADVAGLVVDAIRAERFWVLTDPGSAWLARDRGESIVEGRNPRFAPRR